MIVTLLLSGSVNALVALGIMGHSYLSLSLLIAVIGVAAASFHRRSQQKRAAAAAEEEQEQKAEVVPHQGASLLLTGFWLVVIAGWIVSLAAAFFIKHPLH